MSDYSINTGKVSWRKVDGEVIVIHLETTNYYAINKTGSILWEMMSKKPYSEADLITEVSKHYNVDRTAIIQDIQYYLKTMLDEDLINEGANR